MLIETSPDGELVVMNRKTGLKDDHYPKSVSRIDSVKQQVSRIELSYSIGL